MTQALARGTEKRRGRAGFGDWFSRLGPILGLVLVIVIFGALNPADFLTLDNFTTIFYLSTVVVIGALGMTLIIISGGIDLSVGSSIALTGVVIAQLLCLLSASYSQTPDAAGHLAAATAPGRFYSDQLNFNEPGPLLAIVAALGGIAVACAAGGLIGALITKLRLPPFIVTLGMWSSLRGLAEVLAQQTMVRSPPTWIDVILKSHMTPVLPEHPTLQDHLQRIGFWITHFPYGVWLAVLLSILVALLLRYTRFGRHIYAIGSNEATARLCGIRVDRTKILVYTLGGFFVGIAGLLQFSFVKMGDPTTANGKELDIIAAVVVGGASLSGGRGGVAGTIIGALIMATVDNGCTNAGVPNSYQRIITGGIIVLAVAVDQLRLRFQK